MHVQDGGRMHAWVRGGTQALLCVCKIRVSYTRLGELHNSIVNRKLPTFPRSAPCPFRCLHHTRWCVPSDVRYVRFPDKARGWCV